MAGMSAMQITHKALCVHAGVKQGHRVYDPDAGIYLRVTGISRIPARGGIEAHYLLDLEQVTDGAP
jgi:hypothetical protein